MKTLKLTALLAVLSITSGISMAQPPDTTGTARMGQRGDRPGMMGRQQDAPGPHAKLTLASRLESLTEEQKTKINALLEEGRAEMQAMREEMRAAMEQARSATDREARQKIMEPIRQKHQAIQQKVDAALQNILNSEQMQEINQRFDKMREGARERMGGRRGQNADDAATTGKKARKGADGERKGRKGDREGRKGAKAGAANDAATTGSDTAENPFADQ